MSNENYEKPELDTAIKDLTIQDKLIKIHPNIPSLPTNMVLYGKSNAGKTNVIINLMNWYKKYFKNRCMVFTKTRNGTLFSLEKSLNAKIFHNVINDDGENIIQVVLDFQKAQKEAGEELKPVCIILDDWVTDSSLRKKGSVYELLFSAGRHYNVTTLITTQQYTMLPSVIRRLSWNDIVYGMSNKAEKKAMIYELCNAVNLSENDFEKVYDECIAEPYSFMYVDKRKGTWSKRFGK